jgi:Cu+-exporting ATPase
MTDNISQLNEIDLVCGYKTNINSSFYINYDNNNFYFCSEKCKKTFERNPDKYISNNYVKQKKVTSILNSNYFDKILKIKILNNFSKKLFFDKIIKISGIYSVSINKSIAEIKYNSKLIKDTDIVNELERLGYKIKNILNKEISLFIEDIDLPSLSNKLIRKLNRINGINDAYFNFVSKKLNINYNSNEIKEDEIISYINKIGYKTSKNKLDINFANEIKLLNKKSLISISIFIFLIVSASLKENFKITILSNLNYISFLLATIIQFIVGGDIYKNFIKSIIRKDIDNNFLVAFSSLSIYIYSTLETFYPNFSKYSDTYFEVSVLIITIFTLYKYFIYYVIFLLSKDFKSNNLDKKTVKKVIDNNVIEVDISQITKEDILLLSKDDVLMNDSVVLEGNCIIDELFDNGLIKNKGDIIKSGSIIRNGEIKVQVLNTNSESFISKLNLLIQKSFNFDLKLSRINFFLINYFTSLIFIYSLIVFLFWLLKTNNIVLSIQYFSSVIAFSIPFVIPMSTIIITFLSIKKLNTNNIFPKDFNSTYTSSDIKYIILDKSIIIKDNTIITDIMTFNGYDGNTILKLIASAENLCPENNISKAILREVKNKNFNLYIPDKFEYFEDMGFCASINGYFIMAGNKTFFKSNSISIENMERTSKKISENGKTLLYVTINNKEAGIIAISNYIDEDAENLVKELNNFSFLDIMLISSDSYKTNYFIAENIGIRRENVISELSTHEKLEYLEKIRKKGKIAFLTRYINNKFINKFDITFTSINNIDRIESKSFLLYKEILDIVSTIKYSKFIRKKINVNLFLSYSYYIFMMLFSSGLLSSLINILPNPKVILLTGFIYFSFILINSLEVRDFKF